MKLDIKLSDNFTGLVLVIFILSWLTILSILFDGQPDLYDVLMNKISNGQVAIPAPPTSIWE